MMYRYRKVIAKYTYWLVHVEVWERVTSTKPSPACTTRPKIFQHTDLKQLLLRLGLPNLFLHLFGLLVEGLEAGERQQRRGRHPRSLNGLAEELHVVLSGETAALGRHPHGEELCVKCSSLDLGNLRTYFSAQ